MIQCDRITCPTCGGFIEFDMSTECGSCDTCSTKMEYGKIVESNEVSDENRILSTEKQDYSEVCTMDDDHDEHCWSCFWFCFPIGCMKGEV